MAMTTHSTIRNGLRTLVASLFAACLLAVWPLSANAKGNNSSRVQTHDITITHKYDKASPVLAKKNGGKTKAKSQEYMKFEMKNVYISQ